MLYTTVVFLFLTVMFGAAVLLGHPSHGYETYFIAWTLVPFVIILLIVSTLEERLRKYKRELEVRRSENSAELAPRDQVAKDSHSLKTFS